MTRYRHDLPQLGGRLVPHRRRHRDDARSSTTGSTCRTSPPSRCSSTDDGADSAAEVLPRLRWRSPAGRRRARARERRPGAPARTGQATRLLARGAGGGESHGRAACSRRCAASSRAPATRVVISGCVGPRGDGYDPDRRCRPRSARPTTPQQIRTFADTAADLVTAITMNYADEAIGVARAARAGGHAGRDLLHRRDRRPPADRPDPARGDRGGRRGDRRAIRPTT